MGHPRKRGKAADLQRFGNYLVLLPSQQRPDADCGAFWFQIAKSSGYVLTKDPVPKEPERKEGHLQDGEHHVGFGEVATGGRFMGCLVSICLAAGRHGKRGDAGSMCGPEG